MCMSSLTTALLRIRAGEQRTIPLTCPAERWDPGNTWTKDVYVMVTLSDESSWGDGNGSEDPLDPWG